MDPEIAAAFNQSAMVSSKLRVYLTLTATNGKGVHMLKVGSKRRRTAAQLADLKEEELRKEERAEELERKNKELQQKLEL